MFEAQHEHPFKVCIERHGVGHIRAVRLCIVGRVGRMVHNLPPCCWAKQQTETVSIAINITFAIRHSADTCFDFRFPQNEVLASDIFAETHEFRKAV